MAEVMDPGILDWTRKEPELGGTDRKKIEGSLHLLSQ